MIVLLCLESPSPGRASRAALDLACTLVGPVSVVAISAGGAADGPAVMLARSCPRLSRVVHLDDATFDQMDFMTMGMVLAEAARRLEASIVLAGDRSDDEGQGLVPAALAYYLRARLLSRVQSLRISPGADTVEVTVRAGGQRCTLAAHAPLVLTTCARLGDAAFPSGPPVCELEKLGLTSLGIDGARLVPRPDLLGAFVPKPIPVPSEMALAEACQALLRHR